LAVQRADALTTLRQLPTASIWLVSAFHVVEHLPFDALRALVAEALRVLRPGDVAGLEALANARYDTEAIALVDSQVCRIPLSVLHHLSSHSPRLHKRLMQKWQQALKDADDWLADLNFGSARQRVAALALKMRDTEQPQFTSFFARDDMGAMLDIKLETVSREISGLVREGALKPCDKQGRRYEITNEALLLP
jgi:CRP-like cAMP-binding protein